MPRDDISAAAPFLGVERSLTGRRWLGPSDDLRRVAERTAQVAGLAPPVAAVLARLGVDAEGAAAWMAPKLRDLMPDPMRLKDMGAAAERLSAAVEARERIAIFADYDVDGGASAAVLIWWLRALGLPATLYVPDRIAEGYGPNAGAIAGLAADHDLIVCVDCGTAAHGALAAGAGTDILVVDHHLGAETLPPALAVVNPNRQDEDGALGHLCAAAVTFLLIVETARRRRAAGLPAPDAAPLLDLVALATVADVAPLRGVNRAFVRAGLGLMARDARPGIAALAQAARLTAPPACHHLGFVLGPRINAGGRIGRADLGARLLAAADPDEAAALAARLEEINAERRAVQAAITDAATAQAEARGMDGPLVWAASEGWHPGVLGIVAGHLARRAGRPAIVLGLGGGMAKGSGRSAPGIDLGRPVQRALAEGLLATGGGHEMAAGLSVPAAGVEAAMARIGELLARQGAGLGGPRDLALDGLLTPEAATLDLCDALERAGPFGQDAPAPRFAVPDARILDCRTVGADHLKLAIGDPGGARLDAIAFGAGAGPLAALRDLGGRRVHLAGTLEANHWQGRARVQLRLADAALP